MQATHIIEQDHKRPTPVGGVAIEEEDEHGATAGQAVDASPCPYAWADRHQQSNKEAEGKNAIAWEARLAHAQVNIAETIKCIADESASLNPVGSGPNTQGNNPSRNSVPRKQKNMFRSSSSRTSRSLLCNLGSFQSPHTEPATTKTFLPCLTRLDVSRHPTQTANGTTITAFDTASMTARQDNGWCSRDAVMYTTRNAITLSQGTMYFLHAPLAIRARYPLKPFYGLNVRQRTMQR